MNSFIQHRLNYSFQFEICFSIVIYIHYNGKVLDKELTFNVPYYALGCLEISISAKHISIKMHCTYW